MRSAKAANRRPAAKSGASPRDVDACLARVPEPARSTLGKIREAIRSAVPREAVEIFSYGIPAFRHKGVLVWYAAFSSHCSFFPTASVIAMFKDDLRGFATSKGTIHFPIGKPLPAGLVRKLVRARAAQNEGKKRR